MSKNNGPIVTPTQAFEWVADTYTTTTTCSDETVFVTITPCRAAEWITVNFKIDEYKSPTVIGRMKGTHDCFAEFSPSVSTNGKVIITGRTESQYDTLESAFENFTKKEQYETR